MLISLYETDEEGHEEQVLMVQAVKFGEGDVGLVGGIKLMTAICVSYAAGEIERDALYSVRDEKLQESGIEVHIQIEPTCFIINITS